MLVSRPPISHLDRAHPLPEALSTNGVFRGGGLMASSASGSAVLVDTGQVLVGLVVRGGSGELAGPAMRPCLVATDFASVEAWSVSEPESSDMAAPESESVGESVGVSVGVFVQPVPRGSSLVASFRLLQSSPRNGFAMTSAAMVPCPGPSGGTAWRL